MGHNKVVGHAVMSGGQLPTNHLHDINWARPLDHVSRAPQLMFIWKVTKSVYTHTHTHTHTIVT